VDDLREWSNPVSTSSGHNFTDIFRISSADGPERALKAGQHRIGGTYKCLCGVATEQHSNLIHCFRIKYKSLTDKQMLLKEGILWKRASIDMPNAFANTKVKDITNELNARRQGTRGMRRPDLDVKLNSILHGVHRVPDLLFNLPNITLNDINCGLWEISEQEFMHDFTNFFGNIMEELPAHITNDEAAKRLVSLFKIAKGDRSMFRGCDARLTAIHLTSLVSSLHREGLVDDVLQLCQALVEVSEIASSSYFHRTATSVLRFHNLTFILGYLLKKILNAGIRQWTPQVNMINQAHQRVV
jgi:hypothetical protein